MFITTICDLQVGASLVFPGNMQAKELEYGDDDQMVVIALVLSLHAPTLLRRNTCHIFRSCVVSLYQPYSGTM